MGPERKYSSTGGFCGSLPVLYSGAEKDCFDAKMEPNSYPKQPKWNHKGAKTKAITLKDTLGGRTNIGKECQKGFRGAGFWDPFLN